VHESPASYVIQKLSTFARLHKDSPCLAYIHGQTAQSSTVGKRTYMPSSYSHDHEIISTSAAMFMDKGPVKVLLFLIFNYDHIGT
jgi:hypothetical protein